MNTAIWAAFGPVYCPMSNTTVVATLVIDTGDLGTQGLLIVRVPHSIVNTGTTLGRQY